MRFEIDNSVFDDPANEPALLSLADQSARGRLYISTADRNSANYLAWRERISRTQRDFWDQQINWYIRDSANVRVCKVRVAAIGQSRWEPDVVLSVHDALILSHRSFDIVLENGRNDRAFILAMASRQQRRALQHLEHIESLRFDGQGGIGELKAYIRDQVSGRSDRRLRFFALFDSDSTAPGVIHERAQEAVDTCEGANVPYHCLPRRAIENYVPTATLQEYVAASSSSRRNELLALVRTFSTLSSDQRHHFPMKTGLPTNMMGAQQALYANIQDPAHLESLRVGFPKRLAEHVYANFDNELLRQRIEQDGGAPPIRAAIERILFFARGANA